MTTNKILYETGATTHAVNDLILFTDNTRLLAQLRDDIYTEWVKYGVTRFNFIPLFESARRHYINEFMNSGAGHIINMSKDQIKEYCTLYANDFDNWKKENNIS